MSFKFTNPDKWNDSWFANLKPEEKLLFIYLYENCDIAGFIEINFKRWSVDIGYTEDRIKGACKGLDRGLIYSTENDCIYIKNYLKHQKNYPLNIEKNPAHRGIYKRFELYSYKFNIQDINEFIEGAMKGVIRGIGIDIGNSNSKVINYMYNKFYDSELLNSENNEGYEKIIKILFGNNNSGRKLDYVLKMEQQINFKEYTGLLYWIKKYNINIIEIFEAMDNWKDLKKNNNVSRTAITFIKRRLTDKGIKI